MGDKTVNFNDAFLVRRTVRLRGLTSGDRVEAARNALSCLVGMKEVAVDSGHQHVVVRYDSSRLSFGEIEQTLVEAGCPPAPGSWMRLKAALYRYMDANAHENAGHKPAACCSNPSEIYARRHR